ncbi:MAG: response regulator transcription factor [Phycisphaerae bacterium]|nr:response regulator transcription factor [Phycisphaerae bacterium]
MGSTSQQWEQPERVVLLVEAGSTLHSTLSSAPRPRNLDLHRASDVEGAVRFCRERRPDIILLDRSAGGSSVDPALTRLKSDSATSSIPIMVVAEGQDEADALVAFALGADDYITWPFSIRVMLARIRALSARKDSQGARGGRIEYGPFTLIQSLHELRGEGREIQLTPTEFELARLIISAQGRVVRRSQLIKSVFGGGNDDRRIDVHMTALRKKLANLAPWIQTVRGVGYVCVHPPRRSSPEGVRNRAQPVI